MPARPENSRLVVRAVGSETIVYDPRSHKAHCLGPEAAAVWHECDGHRSAAEIAERMRLAGGEPLDETSVAVALRRLERAGLVEGQASRTAGGLEGSGTGHVAGRRAALRRVAALAGLAVASVVVPTPQAAAATCKPNWQLGSGSASQCQRSDQCCSRCCSTYFQVCVPQGTIGGCRTP